MSDSENMAAAAGPHADIDPRLLEILVCPVSRGPLAYAVLDGFVVPMRLVRVFDRQKDGLACIEMFSDGYFAPGHEPRVAAWEAAFAEVERLDPLKIGSWPSVKGTIGRVRADDRTVVIVEP